MLAKILLIAIALTSYACKDDTPATSADTTQDDTYDYTYDNTLDSTYSSTIPEPTYNGLTYGSTGATYGTTLTPNTTFYDNTLGQITVDAYGNAYNTSGQLIPATSLSSTSNIGTTSGLGTTDLSSILSNDLTSLQNNGVSGVTAAQYEQLFSQISNSQNTYVNEYATIANEYLRQTQECANIGTNVNYGSIISSILGGTQLAGLGNIASQFGTNNQLTQSQCMALAENYRQVSLQVLQVKAANSNNLNSTYLSGLNSINGLSGINTGTIYDTSSLYNTGTTSPTATSNLPAIQYTTSSGCTINVAAGDFFTVCNNYRTQLVASSICQADASVTANYSTTCVQ